MGQLSAVEVRTEKWTGGLDWTGRHLGLGLVLLGTLVVAILAWGEPHHAPEVAPAADGEDIPLFI